MSNPELSPSNELAPYAFDRATNTACVGTKDGLTLYTGSAIQEWCIGDVPHVRSYILAIITDAVLRHFEEKHQKDPIAMNGFFLHKSEVAPTVVAIQDLKTSRKGYCLVKAMLFQPKDKTTVLTSADDFDPELYKEKVHVIFTMGNMDGEEGVTHFHEPYQAPDRSIMEPYEYFFMGDYVEALLQKVVTDDESGRGAPVFNQSIKFKDGRDTDFKAIPYWCDMFIPPPVMLGEETLGGRVWCPTMQLEVQFKRRPACKEVISSIVAPHIINNRFDASGGIWDLDGNLIALTRHQCLIVPWSRNSKKDPSKL
ncbi:thioesterase-like superfamily-domain-containing protein [Fennellomyces sp. T-0311]|nr:thioesterase-like superfamily-domain-containing protein [Fennellomyces sp. T-0311]